MMDFIGFVAVYASARWRTRDLDWTRTVAVSVAPALLLASGR